MDNLLKVGELTAEKGTKVQGYISIINTNMQVPVTLINGASEGKTIVITGGVHGGEYPGVETSVRLAKSIQPSDISGRLIIVHPVNVEAFFAKTQYINPLDGKNLNRVFPGKPTGTITERIAYTLTTEIFAQSDFYIDMHGGDLHEALVPFVIYPKLGKEENIKIAKEAASMVGVKYAIGSLSENGSIGSAALNGVPGMLVEIGQCGLWSEEDVEKYINGMLNVLKHFNVIEGEAVKSDVVYIDSMKGINADETGLWYPSVKPGDSVKTGDSLGEIRDFFTNVLIKYNASQDGTVLYVASSLPVNAGDPLCAWG